MRWAVVGAGSAGCVVAARLSEDPDNDVTLYEAGPDLTRQDVRGAVDGPDALAALETPGRTFEQLMARRVRGGAPTPYQRGRGVGGSSVVNAMVAVRGDAAQYAGWGWSDVEDAWGRVLLPEEVPGREEIGPLGRALLAAERDAVRVPLCRRQGRRVTSAEAYLWPALDRPNLAVRSDAEVARVALDGRRVIGVHVRRADGSEVDAPADRVVLCAGAVHTPDLLLRSGVTTPGVGDHLQDHPSVSLTLELSPAGRRAPHELAVSTVLDRGPWQLLPIDATRDRAGHYGLLLCALMRPGGRTGTVRPGPTAPQVDLHLLDDPADRRLLREAVVHALDVIERPAFASIVTAAYADEHGTPATTLLDEQAFERWLPTAAGGYVHASSSCAMGRAVDEAGRLVGYEHLLVCDASVFPEVPHAHPHLPVTMLAERLVAQWRDPEAR